MSTIISSELCISWIFLTITIIAVRSQRLIRLNLTQLPKTLIRVGKCMVSPATLVRDLDIDTDADISGQTHVAKIISACFAALRRLQSIRCSIPSTVYWTLVVSLVLSRFDNGNAAPCGLLRLHVSSALIGH
jgi:hypothetical protein